MHMGYADETGLPDVEAAPSSGGAEAGWIAAFPVSGNLGVRVGLRANRLSRCGSIDAWFGDDIHDPIPMQRVVGS